MPHTRCARLVYLGAKMSSNVYVCFLLVLQRTIQANVIIDIWSYLHLLHCSQPLHFLALKITALEQAAKQGRFKRGNAPGETLLSLLTFWLTTRLIGLLCITVYDIITFLYVPVVSRVSAGAASLSWSNRLRMYYYLFVTV